MTALRLAPRPVILLAKTPLARAPPRPGRRAASPPRSATTTIRRCMPPTRWPPAPASAIPPSLPASPRRRRPPSPSSSARRRLRPRRRRPFRAGPGGRAHPPPHRPRQGDGTGARSCARWSPRCAPRPRSPSSKAWRRAACWSTIAASPACWRRGRGAPACCRPAAVVLATGGLGGLYAHTTNPLGAIGQGLALAARAGAALADLEFVQFHPDRARCRADPMPLVTEAVRGEGAVLVDEPGARFMAGHGRAELAPRDVVARAVAAHSPPATACSSMRARRWATDFARHFPGIAALCRAAGIDPGDPADPGAAGGALPHGRRRRGRDGRSSIAACGRAARSAATGLHGANRLASNSLLEALVAAGSWPTASPARASGPLPAPRPVALPAAPDAGALRALVSETLGVVRERAGLETRARAPAAARLPRRCGGRSGLGGAADRHGGPRPRGKPRRPLPRRLPASAPAWARRLVQRVDDTGTRVICRAVPLPNAPQPIAGA